MKFNVIDTEPTYRRLLDAPDAAAREAIFRAELVTPFAGMINIFGGGDGLQHFRQWGMTPEQFAGQGRAAAAAALDALAAHDAWSQAAQALEDGQRAFADFADRIPLDTIVFALLLSDMSGIPLQRGYSGFGGIPGYIMTVYGEPSEYNLARIKGATAHELHHNVRFSTTPFNIATVTLGDYIIVEGLAESFAAELYGEEVIGFYVTDFDESQFDLAKRAIGSALELRGFNELRGYIFGDTMAAHTGAPKAGVPDYAGYAIGYRVVQQYLARTGKTVAEATFVSAQEIIATSGFFR